MFWARSSYAVIKVKTVEGWGRISSKRIADDLKSVSHGKYDFQVIEHLLLSDSSDAKDSDDANEAD